MPVIYSSPAGQVRIGWLGGYSVKTPHSGAWIALPHWLKIRVTDLFTALREHGHDCGRDPLANALLWEYAMDCLEYGQIGQAAAASIPVSDVLGDMLDQLRPDRQR